MTDQNQGEANIFSTFEPTAPPANDTPKPNGEQRPKRNRRQRAAAPKTEAAPKKKPGRPRKPRTDRQQVGETSGHKLDLSVALAVASSLKIDDIPVFSTAVNNLKKYPKAQRARLLEALGKVFA